MFRAEKITGRSLVQWLDRPITLSMSSCLMDLRVFALIVKFNWSSESSGLGILGLGLGPVLGSEEAELAFEGMGARVADMRTVSKRY